MPKRLANPVEYLTNPAKHGTYTEGDYVQRLRKAQTLIQEALFILDAPSGHAAGSITERDPGNAAWYRGLLTEAFSQLNLATGCGEACGPLRPKHP